jgi:amidohydrolase
MVALPQPTDRSDEPDEPTTPPTPVPPPTTPPAGPLGEAAVAALLDPLVGRLREELVAFRRDLHAHPELSRHEERTTRVVAERLAAAGLDPRPLPGGTGLLVDVRPEVNRRPGSPALALRADLDALPIQELTGAPYASTVPGVSHACGHDVHTTVVLGAGLVLAELARAGRLTVPVRLVFQPAEEVMPGGALDVLAADGLDGVARILAVHCDPSIPAGTVGVRSGPITAAADMLRIKLTGPGGHTARPHLTGDLVQGLATVATGLPAVLSRRVDARAGLSVVWGAIQAGQAANAIPDGGTLAGTLRCLDPDVWERAPQLVQELVPALVAPYGLHCEVEHRRGVPPVVNDPAAAALLERAGRATLGPSAVGSTPQSMGGEDFAWYLRALPGALARLGTAEPGHEGSRDLHQGGFDVDERAIPAGVRLLAGAALLASPGVGGQPPR